MQPENAAQLDHQGIKQLQKLSARGQGSELSGLAPIYPVLYWHSQFTANLHFTTNTVETGLGARKNHVCIIQSTYIEISINQFAGVTNQRRNKLGLLG